jgi:hypothetical protein
MRQYPLTCGNVKCQTTQTPLWRKGWVTPEGKTIMLCNACGLHYKKGHSCSYCNQIYRESDADDNSNPWIGCDRCSRWTHQKCEELHGYQCKEGTPYMCPECRNLSKSGGGDSLKISVVKKRRRKPTINSTSTPTKRKPSNRNSVSTPTTPQSATTLFSQMVLANLWGTSPSTPGTPLSGMAEHNWSNVMNAGDETLTGSMTLNALVGAEAFGGYISPTNNSTEEEEEPVTPTRTTAQKGRRQPNRPRSTATPNTPTKKRRNDQDNSNRKKRKTTTRRKAQQDEAYDVSQVIDQESGEPGSTNNIKFMQMLLEHQAKVSGENKRPVRKTRRQADDLDYSDGIDEEADQSGASVGDDMRDEDVELPKKKRQTRSTRSKVIVDEQSDEEAENDEDTDVSDEEIIMLEDKNFNYPKVNVTKPEAYAYIKKHAYGISKVKALNPLATLWAVCSLERNSIGQSGSSDRQSQGAK